MASVTYGKCIMANVIMAKIFMAKILWQMKLSRHTEELLKKSYHFTPGAANHTVFDSPCISIYTRELPDLIQTTGYPLSIVYISTVCM